MAKPHLDKTITCHGFGRIPRPLGVPVERGVTTRADRDLATRRLERGLTISEVARETGVPAWWVLAYERGRWVPLRMRSRIAAFLLKHPCLQDER